MGFEKCWVAVQNMQPRFEKRPADSRQKLFAHFNFCKSPQAILLYLGALAYYHVKDVVQLML